MEKDIKKSTKLTLLVGILMLIVIATSTTYAYFKTRIKSPGSKISVTGSNFSLNITDNALTASGLKPIYDKNKSTQAVKKEFTISIGSDGITSACYDLYIDIESLGSNLRNKYFKYEVTNGTDTYAGNFSGRTDGSQILIMRNQNINTTNTSNSYTLYLWLAYGDNDDSQGELLTGDATSRTYKGRILAKAVTGSCKETDTDPTMYSVNLLVINGISDKSSQEIIKGKSATFNITPNDGYTLEKATISCENGLLTNSTLTISNVQNDITCVIQLGEDGLFKSGTLAAQIIADNPTISTRTDFSVANNETTTGTIYVQSSTVTNQMTEDTNNDGIGEDTFYYSGNTTNNWVKFGNFYWRIIRINEDGSVRLLFAGTNHVTGSGSSKQFGVLEQQTGYSLTNTSGMYVGYMYGTGGSLANNRTNENDSEIKTYIDTWYESTLLTNYDKYISKTAIYCNDRSTYNNSYTTSAAFNYASYTRIEENKNPTYKCGGNGTGGLFESKQAVEDKFSASTTGGGNGQLKYPIALMTIDELAFAGGAISSNATNAWFYSDSEGYSIIGSSYFWTMSPRNNSSADAGPWIYAVQGLLGQLQYARIALSDCQIRPVLSLKSCVKYSSGDGTPTNPYQVTIDSTCETAEN